MEYLFRQARTVRSSFFFFPLHAAKLTLVVSKIKGSFVFFFLRFLFFPSSSSWSEFIASVTRDSAFVLFVSLFQSEEKMIYPWETVIRKLCVATRFDDLIDGVHTRSALHLAAHRFFCLFLVLSIRAICLPHTQRVWRNDSHVQS